MDQECIKIAMAAYRAMQAMCDAQFAKKLQADVLNTKLQTSMQQLQQYVILNQERSKKAEEANDKDPSGRRRQAQINELQRQLREAAPDREKMTQELMELRGEKVSLATKLRNCELDGRIARD